MSLNQVNVFLDPMNRQLSKTSCMSLDKSPKPLRLHGRTIGISRPFQTFNLHSFLTS